MTTEIEPVEQLVRETLNRAGFVHVDRATVESVTRDLNRKHVPLKTFVALSDDELHALVHRMRWHKRHWTTHLVPEPLPWARVAVSLGALGLVALLLIFPDAFTSLFTM